MKETAGNLSRDYFFDNLRLFLMFIVVLCHGIETIRNTSEVIILFHEVLLSFVMPMFVFLTGYFAKSMADENSPKRLQIINIILLYVITQATKMHILGYNSFLKPSYGNWFLVAIIVWYMILPLVSKLSPTIVLSTGIIAAILIGIDPQANTVLQTSRVVCFFPYFMLGFYCTNAQAAWIKSPSIRKIAFCVLLFTLGGCIGFWLDLAPLGILHANLSYAQMEIPNALGCMLREGWYIVSLLICFGITAIIPRKQLKISVYGSRTLPIYIIHTVVYAYIKSNTSWFPMVGKLGSPYISIITFIVISMIVVAVCGNRYFANWFNSFMKYDFSHI